MTARTRLLLFRVLCVAAFALLGVVQFPEVLTGETRWDERFSEYIPWRVEAARQWRSGEIPFFTDRMFGGMPMLALGYAGVLYPPNALYVFVPPPQSLEVANILYVFHTIVGGMGMMALLRSRRLHPVACLAGAMFFAAGTFGLCHSPHISMREGGMVAPWIAWAARRAAMRADPRRVAALAVAVAVEAYVGYPQMLLFALCWAGVETLCVVRISPAGLARAGAFGLAVAAGLALAAPQLLPGKELVPWTTRGALDIETWQTHSFDPRFAPHLLMPRALSEPDVPWFGEEPWGELGITVNGAAWALAAAALAFACMRRGRARLRDAAVLWCGVVAAFLLACGSHFAPNALLFHVSPFGLFRIPSRWLWLATAFVCVLAAQGMHLAIFRARRAAGFRSASATVAGSLAALCAVFALLHVASSPAGETQLAEFFAGRPSVLFAHLAFVAVPLVAAVCARPFPKVAGIVLFAALAGEYRFLSSRTASPATHPGIAVGAVPHPLLAGVDPATVSRIFPMRLNGFYYNAALLPQATNLFLGWPVLTGYAPTTHRNLGYWPKLSTDGGTWMANEMFDNPSPPENFGVSHLMIDLGTATPEQRASFDARIGKDWRVVSRGGDCVLVELLQAPGRFQLAPKWLPQADLSLIDADWWNREPPRRERAILVQTPDPAGFPPADQVLGGGSVEVLEAAGGSFIRLKVRSDGPGVLLVRDAWWPGWECRTISPGGISAWSEPAVAQGMMRAMGVPAGESVAEMRYVSPGWRKGLPWAAMAGIFVAALLFWPRRHPTPSEAFA